MNWAKEYGDCEGPLGFPMPTDAATQLDDLLKANPDWEYQRLTIEKAAPELSTGERADISWISTESVDADKEIVLASGFDDSVFKHNPMVTLNHSYWSPPVGRSVWRQKVKEDGKRGVKAKTTYPSREAGWPEDQPWPSDPAWALVKAGLMRGKSIGFVSLISRPPTDDEIRKHPEMMNVRRIIEKWLLVEYCCCWRPANPQAVVEQVAKYDLRPLDLKAFGIEPKQGQPPPPPPPPGSPAPAYFPFTPFCEVEKAIQRGVESLDLNKLADEAIKVGYHRARGRV